VRLRDRLARGIAWNAVGMVCTQGSTLAVNLLVANILGRETFGRYAIVQGALATLSNIAQLAVSFTVIKFVAELRTTDPARAARVLGLSSLVSMLSGVAAGASLALCAPFIAVQGYRAPELAPLLVIASAAVVFSVVNGFHWGALAGLEAYSTIGGTGVFNGIVYVLLCGAAARWGGLAWLVGALSASGLIQCVTLRYSLRRECARAGIPFHVRGAGRERHVFSGFAIPSALGGLSCMAATWVASVILVRQPSGITDMALFAAANNFRIALLFLPNVVNNVGLSLLNQQRGVGDHARSRDVFQTTLWMNLAVTCTGALVLAVAAPLVLRVFGRGFPEGARTLAVLLAAVPLESAWYSVAQLVASEGRTWPLLAAGVVPRDVLTVAAAQLLVPSYGSAGLAAAMGCGWLMGVLTLGALVARGRRPTPRMALT
jgi:O-antigen/teichoic acid export membrane protein